MRLPYTITILLLTPYIAMAQAAGFEIVQIYTISLPQLSQQYIPVEAYTPPQHTQAVLESKPSPAETPTNRQTTTVTSVTNGITTTSTITTNQPTQQISSIESLIDEVQASEVRVFIPTQRINTAIPADRMYTDTKKAITPLDRIPANCAETFSTDLQRGDIGEDVKHVQVFLNRFEHTRIAESGPGSFGNETDLYGERTETAVMNFQAQYAEVILVPLNLVSPTGIWGPSTRAKANELACRL